jgi:spore germination cell wall hydrolase CwlJ-like protein
VIIKNQISDSCTSATHNNSINYKEEVSMKKLVLITLLGLCSLVFAQNVLIIDDAPLEEINLAPRLSSKQIECLAKNMYFEAKSEPEAGIKAVGFVTMNRVADASFPKTICDVVYQRTGRVCQFSWVCLLGKNPPIRDKETYNKIYNVAELIANDHSSITQLDPTKGSLFFHATHINPGWKLKRKIRIGGHIFYSRHK